MYLHKAKQAASEELDSVLDKSGLTVEKYRELAKKSAVARRPLVMPKHFGTTTAADVAYAVAGL
jgi:hypothetical protein